VSPDEGIHPFVSLLPHLTTAFNGLSGVFLVVGFSSIKSKKIERHRNCMLSAFACSVIFLGLYLTRMAITGDHPYPEGTPGRTFYLCLLVSHVLLAMVVPVFALRTLYLGLKDRRDEHRKWGRITFPIWMYVSVTGVLVYWMLYHFAGVA